MTTLSEWFVGAKPRDKFVYYTGELSRDRAMRLPKPYLDQASLALTLAEKFQLHLVQKRIGEHEFEYTAIKPSPEYTAAMVKKWRV